jgi:hypothetical protein
MYEYSAAGVREDNGDGNDLTSLMLVASCRF